MMNLNGLYSSTLRRAQRQQRQQQRQQQQQQQQNNNNGNGNNNNNQHRQMNASSAMRLRQLHPNQQPQQFPSFPGQIIGERHGNQAFEASVLEVLRDPNIVELELEELELHDLDTSVAIRSLLATRKWKSVTVRSCDLAAAASEGDASGTERVVNETSSIARMTSPVTTNNSNGAAQAMDVDQDHAGADAGTSHSASPAVGRSASAFTPAVTSTSTTPTVNPDGETRQPLNGATANSGNANTNIITAQTTQGNPSNALAEATTAAAVTAHCDVHAIANAQATTMDGHAVTTTSTAATNRDGTVERLFISIMGQARRFEFKRQEHIPISVAMVIREQLLASECFVATISFFDTAISFEVAQIIGHGLCYSRYPRELGVSKLCIEEPRVLSALLLLPFTAHAQTNNDGNRGSNISNSASTLSSSPSSTAAAVLPETTQLRGLYFRDCHFSDEHMAILSKSLQYHKRLHQLWCNGQHQNYTASAIRFFIQQMERHHYELEHVDIITTHQSMQHQTNGNTDNNGTNATDTDINKLQERLQHVIQLNRCGRRLLRSTTNGSLWPIVLQRVYTLRDLNDQDRYSIFYRFIQEMVPHLDPNV